MYIVFLYWKTFKSCQKYSTSECIKDFMYSEEIQQCGKAICKLKSIEGQTSPHHFDPYPNTIYYPKINYNFVNKDVYNTFFELSPHSGLAYMDFTEFHKNVANNIDVPYIAHYRTQSIEAFIKRRIIDRLLLIKSNENENKKYKLCETFYSGKHMYNNLKDDNFWLTNSPNINDIVEYIYSNINSENKEKINKHTDGTTAMENIEDISKLYWSTLPQLGKLNYDIYNFYNDEK